MTPADDRRRVRLLSAQAFGLGLTLAWVTVPGNAVFLDRFGPRLLPLTYIGAGLAGAGASVALARSLRRRSISSVASRLLVAAVLLLAVTWAVLARDGTWLSFPVMVVLPLAVPIGLMFVVGQATLLLDVRTLKATYSKVIAGFALGFALGGLVSGRLIDLLGGTEQLFLTAAFAAVVLLVLVVATGRTYPEDLGHATADSAAEADREPDHVTLRSLLSNRFVALLMAFQMLSAVESQWLDYLLYDRASARYPVEQDLADFVGRFFALTYATDIVFLLAVAGWLLRRHGLRLGLSANPGFVLAMVVLVVVTGAALGSTATVVFVLVVGTRLSDLVLSDGTTRTSMSAAYQVIPARERLAAQAQVESLAVPVAIGVSGAVLLAVQATVGTAGAALPLLVAVVLVVWFACSLSIYAHYRRNLLAALRHRVLEPGDLAADDAGAGDVAERLLASTDPRDVRLGLQAIGICRPDTISAHLEHLAAQRREDLHGHVMAELAAVAPDRALAVAEQGLADPSATVRDIAYRTIAATGGAGTDPPRLADVDRDVWVGAAAAIWALGDATDHRELVDTIAGLAAQPDPDDRRLAARLIAAGGPDRRVAREVLAALLADQDDEVAAAALEAVALPEPPSVEEAVVHLLGRRGTAATAVAALVRHPGPALSLLHRRAASDRPDPPRVRIGMARACGAIAATDRSDLPAAELLVDLADAADRDVGLAALRALAPEHPAPLDPERDRWRQDLLTDDVAHAVRLRLAIESLRDHDRAGPLRAALADEAELMTARVRAALAVRHGREPMARVEFQLAQPDPKLRALALEWLDVSLTGPERRAGTLLESVVDEPSPATTRLARELDVDPVPSGALLVDLAEDRHRHWRRPWIRACALLAAQRSGVVLDLDQVRVTSADGDPDGIVAETLAAVAVGPDGRERASLSRRPGR